MATTSGYDTSIRQALVNKGVNSSDIAYNPASGFVTVKGQNAIKAPKVYNGTSFTTQQDFNTQYDAFNRAQQPKQTGIQQTGVSGTTPLYMKPLTTGYQPAGVTGAQQAITGYQQPGAAAQGVGYGQGAGYTPQAAPTIDQRIADLYAFAQTQQAFDPYSSSAYAAAQAQAERAAQQGIRGAQEAYGSAGFGRSTALGERAQRIGQEGTEYLMTQVLPQIQAQEQARRQQEFQNLISLIAPQQQQQQFAEQQRQFAEQTAQGRAGLTGSFISPEAQKTINQLMALKQQAEAPTITREGRAGLSSQADVLRNQLLGMGVDPSLFGAGVTSAQATQNIGRAGMPTLAQQAQDLQRQQANLGAAIDVAGLTGSVVTPQQDWTGLFRQAQEGGLGQTIEGQTTASTLATQQQARDIATRDAAMREWQTTGYATPAVAAALGVPEGTPTSDQSYRQASLTLDQDKFTYAQMTDVTAAQDQQTPTVTGATAGDMLSQALQKVVGTDPITGQQKYGVLSDPTAREEAFVNMINTTGLSGKDVVTALTKAGYSIKEINSLQKEYPEVFQ